MNEYQKLLETLRGDVAGGLIGLKGELEDDKVHLGSSIGIETVQKFIDENPRTFERKLIGDWREFQEIAKQLKEMYKVLNPALKDSGENYTQEEFEKKRKEALEVLEWLYNKVEHYYMCHSLGRWKYRITAIPAIVEGWFD